jgi:hypothetical protein
VTKEKLVGTRISSLTDHDTRPNWINEVLAIGMNVQSSGYLTSESDHRQQLKLPSSFNIQIELSHDATNLRDALSFGLQ